MNCRLVELSSLCGINLQIADKSIQYLEKIVPPFEQPRMPTAKELKESVKTSISKKPVTKTYENLLDYTHRNRVCSLKVDFENFKFYLSASDKVVDLDESLDFEEETFDQVLPNGQLKINDVSDSESETSQSEKDENDWSDNTCLLDKKFTDKYNIKLYNHEVNFLLNAPTLKKKLTPLRDKKSGKFVEMTTKSKTKESKKKDFKRILTLEDDQSSDDESVKNVKSSKKRNSKQNETISSDQKDSDDEVSEVPIDCFDFHDSDISILEDEDFKDKSRSLKSNSHENETILRPYKNYWMYHCIFSRVKEKNFELFEKELPENFMWLLNECASVVEMTTEDLYEEVCLIEAYHFIINSKKSKKDLDYMFHDCSSKLFTTNTLKKW